MITAKQISDWAATAIAQREFPRLVRRLIHASAKTTQITMPAGDSTSSPGLDGELFSDTGNSWVPRGRSCWEASCREDATTKANQDFRKRVLQIDEPERQVRTYVSITARRWPQKAKWAEDRRAEMLWLDVRAYDADDLEHWMEQSPAVELAFGEEIGLGGPGVTSLPTYFTTWATQCDPSILAAALLAGRDQERQRLLEKCSGISGQRVAQPIPIKADSVEEAVAFVAAAILADEILANRSVVVTDASGWRFVERNTELTVAIAARPELADAPPVRDGLVLIVPYASGDMARQFGGIAGRLDDPENSLDRADHSEFEKALQEIGLDENDSRRISTQCGRSWSVFRRQHAVNPAIRRPGWLDHSSAPALATLCLIGTWSSSKEADKGAVARIAGRSYDQLERDLLVLERLDDSPVLHIGSVWKAKSALELLALFGERITEAEIDRFFLEARSMLSTPNPELELTKDERYSAAMFGKTRPISALLIDAICDTLIKLAVRGPEVAALASRHIEGRVGALVRDLLNGADTTRWLSLAGELPALAEASPEAFLAAVEDSLHEESSTVAGLLTETDSAGTFGGRCWHAGLLWALEALGWAPRHLTRVTLILAKLSHYNIAGNWANTPINSIVAFYRPWFPQTGATIEQRIAAIDVLIARDPIAAFKVLDALTDTGHDFATHTARPKWREDDAGAGYGATNIEHHQMIVAAADRHLKMANRNVDQISALIGKYSSFDDGRRRQVIDLVLGVEDCDDEHREIIREALRQKIHWHRNYGDQAVADALLSPLETAYEKLAPNDAVVRNAWLFRDGWIQLPIRQVEEDLEGRQDLAKTIRVEALAKLFTDEGWSGLVRLANHTNGGRQIGIHVLEAGLSVDDVVQWLAGSAGDLERGAQLTGLAAGVLNGAIRHGGHEILRNTLAAANQLGRDQNWKVRLLTLAPEVRETWELVETLDPNSVVQFWKLCNGNIRAHDEPELKQYALTKLIAARRPVTALNACHINFARIDPEIVLEMLNGLLRGVEEDALLPQPYCIQYAIEYLEKGKIIDVIRLAQIEFAFIRALGIDGEHHAVSLYALLMAQPEFFVQLLCIAFKPRNRISEEVADNSEAAAGNAWSVFNACKRQPGTLDDGTVTEESVRSYVAKVRKLALENDRSEVCDIQLGEIIARGEPGEDGIFPSRPIRNVLEQLGSDEMLQGFRTGCFNKRGITSRGFFDGGDQERDLASRYRTNAQALEITHPRVAATLEALAKTYDRHGLMEDLEVRLRREGR